MSLANKPNGNRRPKWLKPKIIYLYLKIKILISLKTHLETVSPDLNSTEWNYPSNMLVSVRN